MFRTKSRERRHAEHSDHDDAATADETRQEPVAFHEESARERYGGFSFAAAFFGWLVAIALTVLLVGIVGAIAAGAGATLDVSASSAEQEADTIGLAAGIALLAILLLSYFAGGYVAGRMSRFDGGRQGVGVWALGLIVSVLVAVAGAVFGTQYNVFERVNLPSMTMPSETLTAGGVVAAVVLVVLTLFAAMLGGKAGQRYHRKVDRAVV